MANADTTSVAGAVANAKNSTPEVGPVEAMVRHDRFIVGAGLAGLMALTWAHVIHGSVAMTTGMAMPQMEAWSAIDFLLLFLMWAVMMTAMMLPSATPMILTFAALQRRRRAQQRPHVGSVVFVAGYLLVWSAYALVAALGQWGLHRAAWLSPAMVSASPWLGAALLMAAGVFQFTPLKHRCLAKCRSPLGFLAAEWRDGHDGALHMGLRHGAYCVGCCWMLMALLFVAGVMNILWIAALAGVVLLEKTVAAGAWVSRGLGVLLAGWGFWMAASALG